MARKSNASPGQVKKRQDLFLVALGKHGVIGRSADAAHISRETVRLWRKNDVYGFRQRYEDVSLDLTEELEDGAMDSARRGNQVDRIFLLKARKPEVYRDHMKVEHGGEVKQRLVLVFPEDKK